MRTPTPEELQNLFAMYDESRKGEYEDFRNNAFLPSLGVALKSERALKQAAAFIQLAGSAITFGGLDPKPILTILMYGFALGVKFSESPKPDSVPGNRDEFENWLKRQEPGEK